MTFTDVKKALADGADPAMLCMTCPWDRFCVTPPSMTKQEIDAQFAEAKRQDEQRLKEPGAERMPAATLLTALTVGGRDTMSMICPVLALRLRLPDGRGIVDGLKTIMQAQETAAQSEVSRP